MPDPTMSFIVYADDAEELLWDELFTEESADA